MKGLTLGFTIVCSLRFTTNDVHSQPYLAFFLFQITKPEFCHGEHLRLEGTTNELALHAHSCE
jgi:hypothetical protein